MDKHSSMNTHTDLFYLHILQLHCQNYTDSLERYLTISSSLAMLIMYHVHTIYVYVISPLCKSHTRYNNSRITHSAYFLQIACCTRVERSTLCKFYRLWTIIFCGQFCHECNTINYHTTSSKVQVTQKSFCLCLMSNILGIPNMKLNVHMRTFCIQCRN